MVEFLVCQIFISLFAEGRTSHFHPCSLAIPIILGTHKNTTDGVDYCLCVHNLLSMLYQSVLNCRS